MPPRWSERKLDEGVPYCAKRTAPITRQVTCQRSARTVTATVTTTAKNASSATRRAFARLIHSVNQSIKSLEFTSPRKARLSIAVLRVRFVVSYLKTVVAHS